VQNKIKTLRNIWKDTHNDVQAFDKSKKDKFELFCEQNGLVDEDSQEEEEEAPDAAAPVAWEVDTADLSPPPSPTAKAAKARLEESLRMPKWLLDSKVVSTKAEDAQARAQAESDKKARCFYFDLFLFLTHSPVGTRTGNFRQSPQQLCSCKRKGRQRRRRREA